jgi:uncharacterized membrane-anchored protein
MDRVIVVSVSGPHRTIPPVWLTDVRSRKVPVVTAGFWLAKLLTTAMGESISDYSVHRFDPVVAVIGGFLVFAAVIAVQLARRTFATWCYWLAASSAAVFGTMVADVTHVQFSVPFSASTALFAIVLACVFLVWYRTEHSLSIHSVDTPRRECFYWATVLSTFALGTAAGDLTATTLHLGYSGAAVLFASLLAVTAAAWRGLGLNAVLAFWTAYVFTRPLGASIADWLGKPRSVGGVGAGDGVVGAAFAVGVIALVIYLSVLARRSADDRSVDRH